jgi:hypothetical protein
MHRNPKPPTLSSADGPYIAGSRSQNCRGGPQAEVAVFGAVWINVPTRRYMEDIEDYVAAVAANFWLASLYTVTVPGPM